MTTAMAQHTAASGDGHVSSNNRIKNTASNEALIEEMLSMKLLQGFSLMESSCPACATPLVKRNNGVEAKIGDTSLAQPVVVPSQSFDQPFEPVRGVPFCVTCQAHVVTDEAEIYLLEQCDSLKDKGSILVALQEVSGSMPDGGTAEQAQRVATTKGLYDASTAASFLCGSTASRQLVAPSPDQAHLFTNEEEGVEHILDQHVSTVANEAKRTVESTILPPPSPKGAESPAHAKYVSSKVSDEKKDEEYYIPEIKDEVKEETNEETLAEYSVRREIATKVLGAKMLQGYTLKETQCLKCGMPLMEFKGQLDCVVCPALAKKAKKKLKEQHRLVKEKERLEQDMQAEQQRREAEEEAANHSLHEEMKRREALNQARMNHEQEKKKREEEERRAEELRLAQKQKEDEEARIREAEEKAARQKEEQERLLEEARARAEEEARLAEEERLRREQFLHEEARRMEKWRLESEAKAAKARKEEAERRRKEEIELLEETRRLERMEHTRAVTATEAMRRDWAIEEERKRNKEAKARSEEIEKMQAIRAEEELEQKRRAEELRAEQDASMLEQLELEASAKAKAAEEAIAKAKAALDHVSVAKREMILQTIALAEAEAIAEAEQMIKAEREEYKAPVVLPTKEQVKQERWETLRTEGRSVMTRRVMAGWTLPGEFCRGSECDNSPLLRNPDSKKLECVVCGGCGDGKDGVYLVIDKKDTDDDGENVEDPIMMTPSITQTFSDPLLIEPSITTRTVQELHDNFEVKRNMVSKEIGKRMLMGWTLLDVSCPNCVMPLMTDSESKGEICILCGLIEQVKQQGEAAKEAVQVFCPVEVVEDLQSPLCGLVEQVREDPQLEPETQSAPSAPSMADSLDENPSLDNLEKGKVPSASPKKVELKIEEDVREAPIEQKTLPVKMETKMTTPKVTEESPSEAPIEKKPLPVKKETKMATPKVTEESPSEPDNGSSGESVELVAGLESTQPNTEIQEVRDAPSAEKKPPKPESDHTEHQATVISLVEEPDTVLDNSLPFDEACQMVITKPSEAAVDGSQYQLKTNTDVAVAFSESMAAEQTSSAGPESTDENSTDVPQKPTQSDDAVLAPTGPYAQLADSIREATRRHATSTSTRLSDPPARRPSPTKKRISTDPEDSVELQNHVVWDNASQEEATVRHTERNPEDNITISLPKGFDFSDQNALMKAFAAAKTGCSRDTDEYETGPEDSENTNAIFNISQNASKDDIISKGSRDGISKFTDENETGPEDSGNTSAIFNISQNASKDDMMSKGSRDGISMSPSVDEIAMARSYDEIAMARSQDENKEFDSVHSYSQGKSIGRFNSLYPASDAACDGMNLTESGIEINESVVEVTDSLEVIHVTSSSVPKEIIAEQFLLSAQGATAKKMVEAGRVDIAHDMAESFVRDNYGGDSSVQKDLAGELVEGMVTRKRIANEAKSEESSRGERESLPASRPRPKPLILDMLSSSPQPIDVHEYQRQHQLDNASSKSSGRRPRITPESMNRGRPARKPTKIQTSGTNREEPSSTSRGRVPSPTGSGRMIPPRPDAGTPPRQKSANGRRMVSPKYNFSSPKSGVIVVGGPGDVPDDTSVKSEASRAETVATQTLDSILNRIEDCKASLLEPGLDMKKQVEVANLIEQLAAAAIAMKKLEGLV